jgi:hypothetical protein
MVMIVSFCPHQFTLIGTDVCGKYHGEVHSIRVHLKSGVWVASHGGETAVFRDWAGVGPQEAEAEILAQQIALETESSGWIPNENYSGQSMTHACMRRGGICSIISSSLGESGPFILPYSDGFEKHATLIGMNTESRKRWGFPAPNIQSQDHHYLRENDGHSLTMMTGMAVRAMASRDWRALGGILDQAWRLRIDNIPQSVMDYYNEAMLLGAWGCSWVAPSLLLVLHDKELTLSLGSSRPVEIDQEGARPLALIRK